MYIFFLSETDLHTRDFVHKSYESEITARDIDFYFRTFESTKVLSYEISTFESTCTCTVLPGSTSVRKYSIFEGTRRLLGPHLKRLHGPHLRRARIRHRGPHRWRAHLVRAQHRT